MIKTGYKSLDSVYIIPIPSKYIQIQYGEKHQEETYQNSNSGAGF